METILDIAKDNLLMMDFVGLQEDLDNDVILLCKKFGWNLPRIPPINVTPKDNYEIIINKCEYKLIYEYVKYDFELYNFAKKMKKSGYWQK